MSRSADTVQGICSRGFEPLREVFARNLASGADLGASLAVTIDGEFVVDLWGGWADEGHTRPWQEDTITGVFSTAKMMASLCALVLVERGALDLDATVAKYWPEFAAAGKTGVKVRHLLSHTSGVSGWEQRVTMSDLCDWEKATSLLAAQAPWWEPGTASGYHMMNYGHLIGEVVRRISGLHLGSFFEKEIAGPLGADFHFGVQPAEYGRLADHVLPVGRPKLGLHMMFSLLFRPKSVIARTMRNPRHEPEFRQTDRFRQANLGAMNGYGNARSVSRALSLLANGGAVDGIRLLSPKTIDRIFEPQSKGIDEVLGLPLKWGVGYALPVPKVLPYIPDDSKVCFWGGYGGSLAIIDVGRRMTISYVMNKLAPGIIGGPNAAGLVASAYACIAKANNRT